VSDIDQFIESFNQQAERNEHNFRQVFSEFFNNRFSWGNINNIPTSSNLIQYGAKQTVAKDKNYEKVVELLKHVERYQLIWLIDKPIINKGVTIKAIGELKEFLYKLGRMLLKQTGNAHIGLFIAENASLLKAFRKPKGSDYDVESLKAEFKNSEFYYILILIQLAMSSIIADRCGSYLEWSRILGSVQEDE
jgi:hypothetical protein